MILTDSSITWHSNHKKAKSSMITIRTTDQRMNNLGKNHYQMFVKDCCLWPLYHKFFKGTVLGSSGTIQLKNKIESKCSNTKTEIAIGKKTVERYSRKVRRTDRKTDEVICRGSFNPKNWWHSLTNLIKHYVP